MRLVTAQTLTRDQKPDSLLGVGAVPAARPVVVPPVASHPRESPGQSHVTYHINTGILDNYEFRRYLILILHCSKCSKCRYEPCRQDTEPSKPLESSVTGP